MATFAPSGRRRAIGWSDAAGAVQPDVCASRIQPQQDALELGRELQAGEVFERHIRHIEETQRLLLQLLVGMRAALLQAEPHLCARMGQSVDGMKQWQHQIPIEDHVRAYDQIKGGSRSLQRSNVLRRLT